MFTMELKVLLEGLCWQSDWNGYEVGFPEIDVIGYYTLSMEEGTLNFYIDIQEMRIVHMWGDNYDNI